ncbi:MAG: alpha/beta fold hydrolase [Acidimicrobiia bacterium]|nr:alpha/beta fold hydrolase [Acidimicrobiia bacterium]
MTAPMNRASWEAAGRHRTLGGRRIFVLDRPATSGEGGPPLVVLHGFPSASFDWRHVLDALGERRRVVLLDFLGYGLSEKPDTAYSLFEQADLVEACATELGLGEIALLTHDMGDSVGGELLARELDGTSDLRVVERVLTNGSIYIGDAQLSDGQQLLLAMPDEILPDELAPDEETFTAGWAATFSPAHPATPEELAAQWELLSLNGGIVSWHASSATSGNAGPTSVAGPARSKTMVHQCVWCGETWIPLPCSEWPNDCVLPRRRLSWCVFVVSGIIR